MFDLEQAIAEWRRSMAAADVNTPEILDELESHLREELVRNAHPGEDPAQAFALSVRELGRACLLGAEFKLARDVEAARRLRRLHLLIGIMGALYGATFTVFFLAKSKYELRDRLLGLSAVAFGLVVIGSWRGICQWLPVFPARRVRVTIGLTLAILGNVAVAVFFNRGLPQLNFTEGQLDVVVLWTMTLLAISGSVWHALEEAVRLKTSDAA